MHEPFNGLQTHIEEVCSLFLPWSSLGFRDFAKVRKKTLTSLQVHLLLLLIVVIRFQPGTPGLVYSYIYLNETFKRFSKKLLVWKSRRLVLLFRGEFMARIILSEKKFRSLWTRLTKLNIFPQLNTVDNRSGTKRRQSAPFGPSLVLDVAACQPGPIKSGTAPIFLQVVIQATQRSGSI